MAATWLVGLVVIVGLAAFGGGPVRDRAAPAKAVTTATATMAASAEFAHAVELDQPARRGEVVTTSELVVRGRVAADVAQVRIMLESSGGKPVAMQTIDPMGQARGVMIPFEATFRLDKPRPGGTMVVFVVAIGGDGIPLDAVRRRFVLGAVLDMPRRAEP